MSPSAFTRLPSRRLLVLALAAGLSLAAPAMAQSTGATLRGQVNALVA